VERLLSEFVSLARVRSHAKLLRVTTDHELLQAALVGYQHCLDEIEGKMAEIRGQIAITPTSAPGPGRRKMSASARRRIAAGQKRRWAKFHKDKPAPGKKRKMSAAGRKRIVEATKKRWAEYRAQRMRLLATE